MGFVFSRDTCMVEINLLFAQILLMVGVYIPKSGLYCYVIGMFTHYFWLVYLVWTCHCAVHIVWTKMEQTSGRCNKSLACSCLLCYTIPLVFVAVNITQNYMEQTDFDFLNRCYTPGLIDIVFSMGFPVCMAMLVNTILIFVVVLTRGKSSIGRYTVAQKVLVLIMYAILSILTGLLWICIVVHTRYPSEWLKYTCSILNAAHGVFLLLAIKFSTRLMLCFKTLLAYFKQSD